jgi:CRP-like cAMP-binding protein
MSRNFSRQQLCIEGSDATQQIAIFLFDLEARLRRGYGADYEFDLPMSHESIANYLRFTPETMSRVIYKLQQAGAIRVNRRHIRLLDVAYLNQIAQGARLDQ